MWINGNAMAVDWTHQMFTVVVKSGDKSDDLYNVCNWMKAVEQGAEAGGAWAEGGAPAAPAPAAGRGGRKEEKDELMVT